MSSTRACLLASILFCIPALVAGQTPDADPLARENVIQANANLVLVDVVVANHGNAVHGLNRSQFHIIEDGKEEAISFFDEHQPPDSSMLTPKILVLPPHTFSNAPIYPDAGVVNVLLLDGLNTPVANQAYLHQQMLDYLGKIPPGTTMAIFTLSSRLRLIQGFTNDPAQLLKAFNSSEGKPQSAVGSESNQTDAADDLTSLVANSQSPALAKQLAEAVAGMKQFTADIAAYQTDIRVHMTLDAIQQLARYLSAIPGRKNLIWFSGAFPIALDPDDELNSPFSVMRNYSEDVRATSQLLSEARVAVYPVDARGLMSLPSFDASNKSAGQQGKSNNSFKKDHSFLQKTSNEHGTMEQIAEQTGGKEYVNTNGLKEAVASVIENGSSYYTIGYVPSNKNFDGQYRRLRVQLDNVDAKPAYRRGYYALRSGSIPSANASTALVSPTSQASMQAAAISGAPQTTQILLEARVLTASDPLLIGATLPNGPAGAMAKTLKGPVSQYIVDMKVNVSKLVFESTSDGTRQDAIECVAIAYNSDSKQVNYVDMGMQLKLKPEQYAYVLKNGLPIRFAIDLPQGKIALRMVVNEIATGKLGSLEVPINVPGK